MAAPTSDLTSMRAYGKKRLFPGQFRRDGEPCLQGTAISVEKVERRVDRCSPIRYLRCGAQENLSQGRYSGAGTRVLESEAGWQIRHSGLAAAAPLRSIRQSHYRSQCFILPLQFELVGDSTEGADSAGAGIRGRNDIRDRAGPQDGGKTVSASAADS